MKCFHSFILLGLGFSLMVFAQVALSDDLHSTLEYVEDGANRILLGVEAPAPIRELSPNVFLNIDPSLSEEQRQKAQDYILQNPNEYDASDFVEDIPDDELADHRSKVGSAIDSSSGLRQCIVNEAQGIASKTPPVPYKWGGRTLSGMDCSGLIDFILKEKCSSHIRGASLPGRITTANFKSEMAKSLTADRGCKNASPGDFIWWPPNTNGIGHIGFVSHVSDVVNTIEASGKTVKNSRYRKRSGADPICYSNTLGG